ncbi:MAG TPA: FHA domain-containing protein [Polyangia bacterium]|nr:FHA domain-containing protein [Polyangia bacterium]
MSFLQRILSADYRRALAAEAACDFALAARLYARCGEPLKVAEMHLLRVKPEAPRAEVLAELREAARWAHEAARLDAEPAAARLREVARAVAREASRDAPTVPPDPILLREAAALYEAGGAFADAAECLEPLDLPRAAELWGKAGEIARMESLLDRERADERAAFALREAFDEYHMEMAAGRRQAARAALVRCVDSPAAGAERAEYIRLREELDSRLTLGHVTLQTGAELPVVYTSSFPVWLGREGASGLALTDASVSRRHARILEQNGGFVLEDCASRNGTRLGGIPIGAPLALGERGEIALGQDCALEYRVGTGTLALAVVRGIKRGWRLCAQAAPFLLASGVELAFRDTRPLLRSTVGPLLLDGARAAAEVELLRGDRVGVEGLSWLVV